MSELAGLAGFAKPLPFRAMREARDYCRGLVTVGCEGQGHLGWPCVRGRSGNPQADGGGRGLQA